jgi:hypothetical protein
MVCTVFAQANYKLDHLWPLQHRTPLTVFTVYSLVLSSENCMHCNATCLMNFDNWSTFAIYFMLSADCGIDISAKKSPRGGTAILLCEISVCILHLLWAKSMFASCLYICIRAIRICPPSIQYCPPRLAVGMPETDFVSWKIIFFPDDYLQYTTEQYSMFCEKPCRVQFKIVKNIGYK